MDALGFDVEETKGENLRGSGYWEATRKRPDETGTAAAAAPAEGSRNYGAELDELRREVAALRREGHKGVSVASTEDWGQKESSFEGGGRSARIRLRVTIQSRAMGQQHDNGIISSRRQERLPGEVPVFSGAVSLRPVCRFTR